MAEFKSKEEYEKWKAEKAKRNADKLQKLKEEERLKNLWVCPSCLSANDNSQLKCNCGYSIDKTLPNYFSGYLTASELYKTILKDNEFKLLNKTQAIELLHYLIKRFPETEEASKIKERMDSFSETVTCGKCGATNMYNPKYYQKEKCDKCGDWLHQYLKDDKNDASTKKTVAKAHSTIPTILGIVAILSYFLSETYRPSNFMERFIGGEYGAGYIALGIVVGIIGLLKNRSFAAWTAIGLWFFIAGLIVSIVMPRQPYKRCGNCGNGLDKLSKICPTCHCVLSE